MGKASDVLWVLINSYFVGGSEDTILEEIDQVRRMWTLRVKLDSWSRQAGVDEPIRQRNRHALTESYLNAPRHRFWFYAKMVRGIVTYNEETEAFLTGNVLGLTGPEDTLARGKCSDILCTAIFP